MPAINLKAINPSAKDRIFTYQGTGAIAAPDALITNTKIYPKGTTYIDTAARISYIRTAAAGVVGDWSKVTLVAHT